MTAIIKQPNSPYYYARFKVNGKAYWISTKTTDPREARRIANIKHKLARGEASIDDLFSSLQAMLTVLPQDKQDSKRQELSRRLVQGKAVSLPVSEAWQAWLDTPAKGNPSEKTIAGYSAIWKRFSGWLGRQGRIQFLHEITALNAQDYSANLWASKVSPATYNAHVKFLRSMFNTLKLKAGLMFNPWSEIKTMDKETQGRENFTPEELAVICSKATRAFRYMIALGLYTGMRLGDVVNLRWDNIGKDAITIMPLKTRRKGKKVSMPIHPVLHILLKELKSHAAGVSGYLFPAEQQAYTKDIGAITKRFQQFLNDCGIKTTEEGGAHRKNVIVRKGFHSLRHSFVSLCAANRVPQVAIQELVGHGSPAMTELYSHADFQQKQDAIATLPAMAFANNKEEGKRKEVNGKDKHPAG